MLVSCLTAYKNRIDDFLKNSLKTYPLGKLTSAMEYSLLLGGKRIRPLLVYATGEMLGVELDHLDHVAGSIEAMHAYSLIHDDLPAMDNDDLRRGKPTCHLAFDEATAILAGDSLQAFAFELLSTSQYLTAEQKISLVQSLSLSAGGKGMCYGQSLDLQSEEQNIAINQLEIIHRHKTGDLLKCAVQMGLLCSKFANDQTINHALMQYAQALGLAFQVQDDILNCQGDPELLGKNVGTDIALNKNTYPKLLGIEKAQSYAQELKSLALQSLHQLPFDSKVLQKLAEFTINRQT